MSSYWSRYDDGRSNNGAEHDRSETRIAGFPRSIYDRFFLEDADGELYPRRTRRISIWPPPPPEPFPPFRVPGDSDGDDNDGISPGLRQFLQDPPPRIRRERNVWTRQELRELENPGHTESEFETAMRRLKKQVYQPSKRARRRGLFGCMRSVTKNEVEVERTEEAGGKDCAVCLEAFVPNKHVLVTPCKHMFHEGCITPWVKSHGQCPLCRFAFCERTQSGRMLM